MASFLDDLNNHKFSTRKPKEEKLNIKPPGRQRIYQAPPDHPTYQRAVVKVHHSAPANLARHNQYITREGVGVDGQKPELFTDDKRRIVDGRVPKEGHYTTITLSPEKGHELELQQYTKDFMRQMENDTAQKLHWYAAVHTNTDHPHVHIVVRGRNAAQYKNRSGQGIRYDCYGKQTYFQHEYVKHGMRRVAQKVATKHLGYRTDREIRRQERQELTVDRLTALDRSLAQRNEKLQLTRNTPLEIDRKLAEKQELSQLNATRPLSIDRKLHGSAQAATDGKFTPKDKYEQKRLDTLVGLELAHKHSDDTYSLTQDWQKELREMQRTAPEGSPGHLVPETKEERQRLNALVKMGFARWHGARGYSLNDDWQLALKKQTPSGQQPEIKPANSDQAKRLEHLKELGLATETTRYTYQLKPNWQKKLRDLGHKNDIVKQIHKDAPLSIEAGAAIANNKVQIQGRVVRKDYENEDLKKPYIIIHNNTDGKYYYYASKTADAAQQGQFVRLDKGSLQNEMGEQIHRATPYQAAKSGDPNTAPENPAHPMTAEEYQQIKELAFQSAQREHGETANREYTQSAKWSVRGTVAYADYNEKLGRSIVIIRDKNAANYYYTESSDPKHGNIELNQEAVYVGQEIKIGDEAHAYWTDQDVKDHALSDIQEQHPKKNVESSTPKRPYSQTPKPEP